MAGKIEWYEEFVDFGERPAKSDLVALFYFEPAEGIARDEALGRMASESSVGTWTTLARLPPRIKRLKGMAFEVKGSLAKLCYPLELWEKGNAPQLLSGVAGNIFGMKALANLRLIDITLPKEYVRAFRGPQFGIAGVRRIFREPKRSITATVPKPKVGFSAKEHAEVAYEAWAGGIDLVKDDENLTSLEFNRFEERVRLCAKMRARAERETGERKSALLNITAETKEMLKRAKLLYDLGWEYAMVDVVTAGFAGLQTAREACQDYGLAIHAHRAMHAAFTRNPKHGVSMLCLAKLLRLVGVDQLHIGTAVGKLVGTREEVKRIQEVITKQKVDESLPLNLSQDWFGLKPVFPVSSGGLHPGLVPDVMSIFGSDIIIQAGGGIHGHPDGTRAGAKALRQAIEAVMEGESLEEKAKRHPELARALAKWGRLKPR
ncbi:MAG: type III ribulose-bisphosphate carboxylase [Candidatus Micrarchaeia archaeon]